MMRSKRWLLAALSVLAAGALGILIAARARPADARLGSDAPAAHAPSHARMVAVLQDILRTTPGTNPWLGDAEARGLRPIVAALADEGLDRDQWWSTYRLGIAELNLGNVEDAVRHLAKVERLLPSVQPPVAPEYRGIIPYCLGVAYLRLAEIQNCCQSHLPDSCSLPFTEATIHRKTEGSRAAIRCFTTVLENTSAEWDSHLSARWLLNIAHMTLGEYPAGVAAAHLIPPGAFESEEPFPRFENVASRAGVASFGLSGGAIADDFDNDGWLDLLVSTWDTAGQLRCYRNERDGTFRDRTEEAGIAGILGGLNMVQGDYDNDGNVDVYIMRGAWLAENGCHPNSLLRNLGGGRFTDVTFDAGLGEHSYPSQTAAWADYDNDGDLDLYVGAESGERLAAPCQLFRNNGDGTFTDVAAQAGVTNDLVAKGAVWGDYDGDRWPDLFVSNLDGENRLYRNRGDGTFADVAPRLGLVDPHRSFPAWFWDFDNDGILDLYVSAYDGDIWDLASAALGRPVKAELSRLWKGDGKGGFRDVARERGLSRPNAPMGANFGDLDNDGWLDFYLGTGFTPYDAVMPNVMLRNVRGGSFADVSVAGGFANLQKGHAIVFADFDNDGDQDVFEKMGGALKGDGFYDVLYENPGFANRWVAVRLVGVRTNRSAIGARIRVVVDDGGRERSVYKHVNSGGTFGANPLRQSIGLGDAARVLRMEIDWPTTGLTQTFADVPLDCFLEVTEGQQRFRILDLSAPRPARPIAAATPID